MSTILEKKRPHKPMSQCPYCRGDLDAYRRQRRTPIYRSIKSYRGIKIDLIRQEVGLGFRLNGWRYVDKRGFLTLELAHQAAVAMIDELLDSAQVQALEEDS